MKKLMMTLMLMPMMALASLTDGLVAYYPFDGNANDASGNGNNGVVHGATLTTDRNGSANGAYHFDGTWIEVESSTTLSSVTNEMTLMAWVKAESFCGKWLPLFCKGNSNRQFGLAFWADGTSPVRAFVNDWTGTGSGVDFAVQVPETMIQMGRWYQVAITYNGNTLSVYHDGELMGATIIADTFAPNAQPLYVGKDPSGSMEYFYGDMDDIRIYNRALSAAEVKALYDGTAVIGNSGLSISYYDAGDKETLRSFNMESATYEDAVTYFETRIPSLVSNTFDIGANLDFGGDDSICRFHGKYADYETDYFWAFMKGSIILTEAGLYEFGFNCDDSCVIYIDGQKVIGSSNNYDSGGFFQKYASVQLSAGAHTIAIVYAELWDGHGLTICMKRPSESHASPLPQSILYTDTVTPEPVTYTVTFDLNGADGAAPEGRSVAEGGAVGELPDVTRTGYSFDGWFTAASGGTKITASTTVTGDVTYYAHWIVNQYTMTFDANGGVGGTTKTQDYGTALAAPTVTREGYTFTGWSPSVPSTVPAADATYTAQWTVNQYTATFDANGGTGGTVKTQDYGTALTAPTVTRTGYTFTGWSPAVPTTVPAADATYTAQWRINSYTVTFDAQGGAGGGTVARNHGAALGELPVPTRDGFSFDGWFTAANDGAAVSAGTVITGAVTFYAHWTEQSLYPTPVWFDEEGEEIDWTAYYDGDEAAFAAESAATFDGYVLDGEEVCGIVQVKVAKVDRRSGTSRVSASLTLLGEAKKLSYKGTMSKRGVAVLTCSGKGDLSLCLGTNAMWGELGGKTISGARNVFAKAGDPKAAALSRWQGAYTLVLETVDASGAGADFAWGYSGLTVDIGAKGKVKIKGTMVDGAKVNVVSQLLVGDRRCCIPVVVPLYSKRGGFAFNLWLHDDGTIEAEGMGEWNATASKAPFVALFGEDVPMARAGAALPASLSFMLVGEPDINGMEVLYGFLPWEVQFSAGARWTMPASGSVKYDRAEDEYVDTKDSSNPAGLKLTYVSKTGAFKGSFKMYAVDSGGRLKKLTANVSGVMVGRHGYGRATVKGVGSWPVLIE